MVCSDGCKLFGAYRTAISIKDSAVLIHSTASCDWGTLLFHLQAQMKDVRQASSVIYAEDMIFGGEKQLVAAIDKALEMYEASALFILTGCISEIMGDNAEDVLKSQGRNTPIYLLKSAGLRGNALSGVTDALKAVIATMTERDVVKGSINLIGMFSDDFKSDADLSNIKAMLDGVVAINAVIPYDTFARVQSASAAELNVVFEGFEAIGENLRQKFGTPYIIVRYPYGLINSGNFVKKITEAMNLGIPPRHTAAEMFTINQLQNMKRHMDDLKGMPIAIVGDTARIAGLQTFLQNELGMYAEVVIDISKMPNQDDYEKRIRASHAILLLGSSFERRIAEQLSIPFMQFAYPVFDKISIGKNGYAGFAGTVCLIEDLVNTILGFRAVSSHMCTWNGNF
ncbi:nitrogenase component 1 [Lachnospiraceae bacterium ZAX-1]